MSSIEDPLAKPAWPEVDPSIGEAVLNQLITLKSGGSGTDVLVGFNAVMAAIEQHVRGRPKVQSIYVARHDISGLESMPLALSSAAAKLRLVTLPKGSKDRLDGDSVICTLLTSSRLALLEQLVRDVGHARASWSYAAAKPGKISKKPTKSGLNRNKHAGRAS